MLESGVSVGKDVYVDTDVRISKGVRIQNGVSVFKGVELGQWVFVGPGVVFTNDQVPRVGLKSWTVTPTFLKVGCSLGAGTIVRCGIELGSFCMTGAGAVVTKSIPPFHLALGVPAEPSKMICACGSQMLPLRSSFKEVLRDCCEKNLSSDVLEAAKFEVSLLLASGLEQVTGPLVAQ